MAVHCCPLKEEIHGFFMALVFFFRTFLMFLVSLMIRASMLECPCHFQCKWRLGKAYEEAVAEKDHFLCDSKAEDDEDVGKRDRMGATSGLEVRFAAVTEKILDSQRSSPVHSPSAKARREEGQEEMCDDDILVLRRALEKERAVSDQLRQELEYEREGAESAAQASMNMIQKLQKEKALASMEATQANQKARITIEKAIHDEEAMKVMSTIITKQQHELLTFRTGVANSEPSELLPSDRLLENHTTPIDSLNPVYVARLHELERLPSSRVDLANPFDDVASTDNFTGDAKEVATLDTEKPSPCDEDTEQEIINLVKDCVEGELPDILKMQCVPKNNIIHSSDRDELMQGSGPELDVFQKEDLNQDEMKSSAIAKLHTEAIEINRIESTEEAAIKLACSDSGKVDGDDSNMDVESELYPALDHEEGNCKEGDKCSNTLQYVEVGRLGESGKSYFPGSVVEKQEDAIMNLREENDKSPDCLEEEIASIQLEETSHSQKAAGRAFSLPLSDAFVYHGKNDRAKTDDVTHKDFSEREAIELKSAREPGVENVAKEQKRSGIGGNILSLVKKFEMEASKKATAKELIAERGGARKFPRRPFSRQPSSPSLGGTCALRHISEPNLLASKFNHASSNEKRVSHWRDSSCEVEEKQGHQNGSNGNVNGHQGKRSVFLKANAGSLPQRGSTWAMGKENVANGEESIMLGLQGGGVAWLDNQEVGIARTTGQVAAMTNDVDMGDGKRDCEISEPPTTVNMSVFVSEHGSEGAGF